MTKNVRTLQGNVVKLSSTNTIKVRVEMKQRHPLYGKTIKSHKQYLVHCENSDVQVGDVVVIAEARPISGNKNWSFLNKVDTHK